MKTDNTWLEQFIADMEQEKMRAAAAGLFGAHDIFDWCRDKAKELFAAEKSAMEKAQEMERAIDKKRSKSCQSCQILAFNNAQKPINPVVAAHNEALGPLRLALWEIVEEMDANIKERGSYKISVLDMVSDLKNALEKNPPEQKPPAPASLGESIVKILEEKIEWDGWGDGSGHLEGINEAVKAITNLLHYCPEKPTADKFANRNCYICALYQECKMPHMTGWYGCNKYTPASPEKSTQGEWEVETILGEGALEFDGVESSWRVPTTWRSDGMKCCGKYGKLVFRYASKDKGAI